MQNQFQNQTGQQPMTPNMQPNPSMPSQNHGAHEVFEAHGVLTGTTCMLDQYKIYEQYIQDPELKSIAQHQTAFVTQMYNTIVDAFSTGQDPQVPTQQYKMNQSNEVSYGTKPGQPKKPIQSVNELSDQHVSTFMLDSTKALSSMFTKAALEVNNPVLRRVIADSVPNLIELGYEIFLYQNKHGYYQIPQLMQQDMNVMTQSFTKAQQPGNTAH